MKKKSEPPGIAPQPTIVLIPGVLCDQRVYEHLIQTLQSTYRCEVCLFDSSQTLPRFIDQVMSLSTGPLVLVGHSMAGKIAFQVACSNPDRIQGLCIINSSLDSDNPDAQEKRRIMIEKAKEHPCIEMIDNFIKRCTLTPNDAVREMMIEHMPWFVHQQMYSLKISLPIEAIAALRCPVLLIHSDQDEIFDTHHAHRIAKLLLNYQMHIVDNSGHMTTMEQPEVVTQLIKDWLDRQCLFK